MQYNLLELCILNIINLFFKKFFIKMSQLFDNGVFRYIEMCCTGILKLYISDFGQKYDMNCNKD